MDATLSGLALRRMGGLAGTRVFARETRANPSLNSATSLRLNETRKFRADVANAENLLATASFTTTDSIRSVAQALSS